MCDVFFSAVLLFGGLCRYWKYRDSVSRIECPTVQSHDTSAPANTPAAWVCCGSTRFVDSVAHDAWSTRVWRGMRDEVEEPPTDEDDSDSMDASKLSAEPQQQRVEQPRVLSSSPSSSASPQRSPTYTPAPAPISLEECARSVRTLRRTSSLPPVLPSSMPQSSSSLSHDNEPVTPCALFGQRSSGSAAFADSFTRPGAVAPPAVAEPLYSGVLSEQRLAALQATPEKLQHCPATDIASPLGLVGDEYQTPNRILQFETVAPLKRSMSTQSGNRPKRTRSITRQATLTQLWQSSDTSSSSSKEASAGETSGCG